MSTDEDYSLAITAINNLKQRCGQLGPYIKRLARKQ